MIKFTGNEMRVLKCLDFKPISVAALVRATMMPRMTVYTTLLRLLGVGAVRIVILNNSKRKLWAKSDASKLRSEIETHTRKLFGIDLNIKNANKNIFNINGRDQIAEYLINVTGLNYGKRLYTMQNSSNFPLWVDIFGKRWTNKHNKLLVDNNVIVFSIYSKNIPRSILDDKDIIENYKGRKGNSMAIDDKYFLPGVALYIFENQILFIDLNKLEAIVISNHNFIKFFIKIFELIFEGGDRDKLYFEYGRDK